MKGFTFLELLIVISIISILLILTVPLGVDFYRNQQLDSVTQELLQNLRRAHLNAMSQSDYSFGIWFGPEEYKIFRGDSEENGENEEFFDIPGEIYFNSPDEIVFSKLTGNPSFTGDIYVTNGISTTTVNINSLGRLSYISCSEPSPPQGCWGTGGSCDSGCQYANRGTLLDYYIEPDPLCNRECEPIGRYLVDPSGTCSEDGTGECYKLEDPTTQSTECNQGESCKGDCGGTCTPCGEITDPRTCDSQEGCTLLVSPGGKIKCIGRCTPCREFEMDETCAQQLGCTWEASAWYWNLESPLPGYFNYTNCEWYEE